MKFLTAITLISIMSVSALASAETKIGLIDMRTALFSSKAAKTFTESMVSQYKQQDLEVRAVGEDGQKLELRLKNDAAIMSDSERNKMASDLEAKIQEYKYLKGKLDKALAEERQEFLAESKPRIDLVVNEIVTEEGLDLLLPREAVLFASDKMDYTVKMVEKLDKIK